MMLTPGEKPFRAKALNSDASLIFAPDLTGVLPMLPPFIQDAVKALPESRKTRR